MSTALLLISLGSNFWAQRSSDATVHALTGIEYQRLQQVAEWQLKSSITTTKLVAMNRSGDPALAELFGPEIEESIKRLDTLFHAVDKWAVTPKEREHFAQLDKISNIILEAIGEMEKARAASDEATAHKIFDERFLPATKTYEHELNAFFGLQQAKLQRRVDEQAQAQWTTFWVRSGVTLALMAGVLVFIALLVRYVRRSLHDAVDMASAVARGDLTVAVEVTSNDEFGSLAMALDSMADNLRNIVMKVREGTTEIESAAREIAQGNSDLSERTETSASRLEMTASTMEQLMSLVHHSTATAAQANQLAGDSRTTAQQGSEAMNRLVTTMTSIEAASKRIEEITGVIESIAFQTNILALNAAVEAARAGEHGRGFSVVAGEVRLLAHRASDAAKQIKQLIDDAVTSVRSGSSEVGTTTGTISELTVYVDTMATLIDEIQTAAQHQRGELDNVSTTVSDLDKTTQQNAALVEEAAAAAAAMRDQAATLSDAVSIFRLEAQH